MRTIEQLDFETFATRYCERQEQTKGGLHKILLSQRDRYQSEGFMLLQCEMMDSSRCGEYTILGYGGQHTFKTVPDQPISPRGLASDMSVVVAVMTADKL